MPAPAEDMRAHAYDVLIQSMEHTQRILIAAAEEKRRYEVALRTIIDRADTDKPDADKVRDIRRIAEIALGLTPQSPT